ncbi:hypothetical protein [Pelagicoccus sp. SDUM812002]|uniref:hypothetical protein n=1 Tax=Pelagicoccus sp. SDUM812002 TaxID=3041266 RepID=UPI00280FEB9D|nr:hypothetical protein [Pelagicoccus sp. SDUM812002]MDQ8184993.1 hypothetical protein [Pelagicoccus sp. SDUM812002]
MNLFLLQKLFSARLHLALGMLMLILQRSPIVKMIAYTKHLQPNAPVVRIIQSIAIPAATLAAPHAVSGASTSSYDVEYINTPELKVGVEAVIKFSNTITPRSWTIEGNLPPGMRVTDLRLRKSAVNGVITADIGIITGTPNQAGTYDLVLTPWSNVDGTGDTAPEPEPGALRIKLTVLPDQTTPLVAPVIVFKKQNNTLTLNWDATAADGFSLKESYDLGTWLPINQEPTISDGDASIIFPLTSSVSVFYRLEPES